MYKVIQGDPEDKAIGVTECTLATCNDEECLNEIKSVDMALAI